MIFVQDYVLVQSTHGPNYFFSSSAGLKCFLLGSSYQSSNLLLFYWFETFFLLRYLTWLYHFFAGFIKIFCIGWTFPVVVKFPTRIHDPHFEQIRFFILDSSFIFHMMLSSSFGHRNLEQIWRLFLEPCLRCRHCFSHHLSIYVVYCYELILIEVKILLDARSEGWFV
jgi:hypothetical protein